MRRILVAVLGFALTLPVWADIYAARYGVSETFDFWLYNADGTLDVDEVDGGTEVSVSCNEGAETTATNDFVDEGTFYSITLTASEMQCERVVVVVAATVTGGFIIQTDSNASAMRPTYESNVASVTTGAIDNGDFATTPGASGGLLIAGTNADFNVTAQVNFADGLDIARSTSNATGLTVTGNGTGNGATFTSGSGATGNGVAMTAASTNGTGLAATGTGTGNGASFTSGGVGTGSGALFQSGAGATGDGIRAIASSTNGNGIAATGSGTGSGLLGTAGATGDGLEGVGGSSSGAGLRAAGTAGNSPGGTYVGQGTAAGLLATSGAGATGNGVQFTAASTNGSAIGVTSTGTGTVFSTNANANAAQVGGQTASASGTVTFPNATLASTTNITAGTITTVTNLTNAPTAGDLTSTMKASVVTAVASVLGHRTTITVTDQDTFVLGAGATYDNAYQGWAVKIDDAGSQDQWLGKVESYVGSSKTVELNRVAGFTIATGDTVTIYPAFLYETADVAPIYCTTNTANFAGSTSTLACILTDKDGAAVTVSSGDLTGRELLITSGAQAYEVRYLFSTTWDGTNSELQITLDRALPATLADAVTAIIR